MVSRPCVAGRCRRSSKDERHLEGSEKGQGQEAEGPYFSKGYSIEGNPSMKFTFSQPTKLCVF